MITKINTKLPNYTELKSECKVNIERIYEISRQKIYQIRGIKMIMKINYILVKLKLPNISQNAYNVFVLIVFIKTEITTLNTLFKKYKTIMNFRGCTSMWISLFFIIRAAMLEVQITSKSARQPLSLVINNTTF